MVVRIDVALKPVDANIATAIVFFLKFVIVNKWYGDRFDVLALVLQAHKLGLAHGSTPQVLLSQQVASV